jgi:hypothetical protein
MTSTQQLSHLQFRKGRHNDKTDADRVYAQLTQDYPPEALQWVRNVDWKGPKKVPLSRIDWDDERVWKASKEKSHVDRFVKKIEAGEDIKPIILISRPGKPTEMIPDGHHRALAYKETGKNPVAWEGKAHHVVGEWDYLHDSQFKSSAKDRNIYR